MPAWRFAYRALSLCPQTCHTKSVITKPQNVLVLRDIMCSGYVAGGNTKFFGEDAAKDGGYTKENIRRALTKRLSFEDDASGEYDSMLAFAVPLGSNSKRDQVMSISARLLPWEVTSNTPHEYFPGGPAHYAYYSRELGLDQIHFGEDIRAAENMEFISQARTATRLSLALCISRLPLTHCGLLLCRARSTTRSASSAPIACIRSGRRPSTSSAPARATSAPTPSPGCADAP